MLGVAARVPGVVPVAAFSPAGAGRAISGLAPAGMRCVAQRGGDLGARMANLATDLLAAGHSAVLIVGSDVPTVPVSHLAEAARGLAEDAADLVLGPAEDGGYYLIGLRRPAPALFSDVAWGTAAVFEVTLARARALDLRVHLLPPWHDVDTAADLARLRRDLAGAGGDMTGAWRTRRWLEAFVTTPHPNPLPSGERAG
jgi:rSAM/selenodomain-associated transferase 1